MARQETTEQTGRVSSIVFSLFQGERERARLVIHPPVELSDDQQQFNQHLDKAIKGDEYFEEHCAALCAQLQAHEHPERLLNYQEPFCSFAALHYAASAANMRLCQLFLQYGADKTLTNCFGQTPAIRARDYGKSDEIAAFIEHYQSESVTETEHDLPNPKRARIAGNDGDEATAAIPGMTKSRR